MSPKQGEVNAKFQVSYYSLCLADTRASFALLNSHNLASIGYIRGSQPFKKEAQILSIKALPWQTKTSLKKIWQAENKHANRGNSIIYNENSGRRFT